MEICQLHPELVKRLDNCEKEIRDLQRQGNNLSIQQARVDEKLDNITKMIEELKTSVTKLAEQPAKRWDTLINAGITALIALLVSGGTIFASKH